MLRIGLVGTGDAAQHHARALVACPEVAWTAVCSRQSGSIEAFRAKHGTSAAPFTDFDACLEACDAVILATPDGVHADQVVRAANAGRHVLVEKPLALSRQDAERAVRAARANDVRLAVGYHLRHHAAHRIVFSRAPELVGEVESIFVRWAWPDPATDGWRAKGGGLWSIAALGTHGIDLALAIAGWRETDVRALTTLPDRAAEISFRAGNALAHVSCSVTHRAVSRVIVSGPKGELEALGTLGARGDGELFYRAPRTAPAPVPFAPENPYLAQLRAFAAGAGFSDDPYLIANVDILDRIVQLKGGQAPA